MEGMIYKEARIAAGLTLLGILSMTFMIYSLI
jgi:hypothetical protein